MNLKNILKTVAAVIDALVPQVEAGLTEQEQQIVNDIKSIIDAAAQG